MDSTLSPQGECKHYEVCGGCSLQHLTAEEYQHHKNEILAKIIRQWELDESVIQPLIMVGKHSRRRAEFKVRRNKKRIEIGFFEAKTHRLFDLEECPVSQPALVETIPAFKACLATLKKSGFIKALNITLLDNGLDVIISTLSPLPSTDREVLAEFAKEMHLCRFVEQGEGYQFPLYNAANASVSFANVEISLPIGAFLQASKAGEVAITKRVVKHLNNCERIIDLYAGCGTYSFPLKQSAKTVTAYEGSQEMVAVMHNAIQRNQLEQSMSANLRDLYVNPITATELNPYDGAVINPPRNGALPQVKELTKSNINKLVMVSCNPNTFKRDAAHLLKNGFSLTEATPIDQFYWTNHLEVVGVFER